jgi:DNA-binding transcriptional MocR family regulator
MNAAVSQEVVANLLDQVDDLKQEVTTLKADGGLGCGGIPAPPPGGVLPSVEWKGGEAKAQDFIKGWPSTDMISTDHIRASLSRSFNKGIMQSENFLNYGDVKNGAYMLGSPHFRQALAEYLSSQYNRPCDWNTLMTTSGASQATDLALRQYCNAGDTAVVEEPTYFLSHTMLRDRGITNLLGVPMEADGMDLVALEKHCTDNPGKIKVVYTVVVHHNPTGITMSNEKRAKLVALAQKYDFLIIADEAYQLVGFEPMPDIVPLFYHDDPADPKVFSIGTFSKVIGPGLKIGWVQAHPPLLKKLPGIGWIDSGNNPVIYTSGMIIGEWQSESVRVRMECVRLLIGQGAESIFISR